MKGRVTNSATICLFVRKRYFFGKVDYCYFIYLIGPIMLQCFINLLRSSGDIMLPNLGENWDYIPICIKRMFLGKLYFHIFSVVRMSYGEARMRHHYGKFNENF